MRREAKFLVESIAPSLYALNAFRQLRLPSEASTAAAKRELDKLNLSASLRSQDTSAPPAPPPPDGSIHIFLPQQDPGQAREAFRRFSSPELRLIDEFFWFWPHTPAASDEDEALKAIAHDDAASALAIWQAQASRPGEHSIATHNLAVLQHMAALDLELLPAQDTLPVNLRSQRADHWQQCYGYWLELLQHPAFWRRLADRVTALDDPRLPKDAASAFRSSLPLALLLINARLAVAYGDQERLDDVRRQAALLDACGFPSDEVLRAKQIATKPLRERLEAACQSASDQAKKDPVHADQVASDLLDNPSFTRGLATADILFQPEDESRIALHDDLALGAYSCLVAFANKTEQWDTVTSLTQKALQVAQGTQAKARIQEGLNTATENAQSDLHWRLPGYWDLPRPVVDRLELAQSLLDEGDIGGASAVCINLYEECRVDGQRRLIGRPIAMCLNVLARNTLAQAIEPLSAKPSFIVTDAERRKAREALVLAAGDIVDALRYDPANRDLHKTHDNLQGMARKAGVSIPPKPSGARPGVSRHVVPPSTTRPPAAPPPKARIQEGLNTASENAQSDLHWRLPGYWDLPKATLDELERAHDLLEKGGENPAIKICNRQYKDAKTADQKRIIGRTAALCLYTRGNRTISASLNAVSGKRWVDDNERSNARASVGCAARDLVDALKRDPGNRTIFESYTHVAGIAHRARLRIPSVPNSAKPAA